MRQDGTENWTDDLDYACLQHDKCLCAGETDSELLECDYALRKTAQQIADDNDQCTGLSNLNPFCVNDGIVCSAQNTAAGMTLKIDGGIQRSTNNCSCVKHQGKPSCKASSGNYVDDSDYSDYSDYYDYSDNSDDSDYSDDSGSGDYVDDSYYSDNSDDSDSDPYYDPSNDDTEEELPTDSRDGDGSQRLEKFNLEMDWNPSSCFGDDACKSEKITNAFTVSEMTARLVDRSQDNGRCWNKTSDQAKNLVISDEVSSGTKAALECMFENAAGSNEDLWRDVYVRVGSCTGMSPSQYFDAVTRLFMSVGANQIAADFGLLSHNGSEGETEVTVDRDSFLDYMNERVGRKTWIECDPDTRLLRVVLVCVNPNDPFLIQVCRCRRMLHAFYHAVTLSLSHSIRERSSTGLHHGQGRSHVDQWHPLPRGAPPANQSEREDLGQL